MIRDEPSGGPESPSSSALHNKSNAATAVIISVRRQQDMHQFGELQMVRSLAFFIVVYLCHGIARAQLPQTLEMQLDTVSVKLSNIQVITCPRLIQDEQGTRPIDPSPLEANKLYPPNTNVFIKFDFETNFQPSDNPKALKFVAVSVDVPKRTESSIGGFNGYMPASLKDSKGTSFIGLSQVFTDEKTKLAEIETSLQLYGQRNDNTRVPTVTSNEKIRVKIYMDRLAQISERQFDALKAMYKRVQELEARVKQLEASGARK
ncbi:hypothetical protein SH139x_004729 [Planctomycetaceae bacterium SH139]